MKTSSLFLFLIVLLCDQHAYGQKATYVKVIDINGGGPLDSAIVSSYLVSGRDFSFRDSAITDMNGLCSLPLRIDSTYKINANFSKQYNGEYYWPEVANFKAGKADTLTIKAAIMIRCRPIRPPDINFATGSSRLVHFYDSVLAIHLAKAKLDTTRSIFIRGNADCHKEAKKAERLSLRRAKSVEKWFIKNGMPPARIVIYGMGTREAVRPCAEDEYREMYDAMNRRVDIRFYKPAEDILYSH